MAILGHLPRDFARSRTGKSVVLMKQGALQAPCALPFRMVSLKLIMQGSIGKAVAPREFLEAISSFAANIWATRPRAIVVSPPIEATDPVCYSPASARAALLTGPMAALLQGGKRALAVPGIGPDLFPGFSVQLKIVEILARSSFGANASLILALTCSGYQFAEGSPIEYQREESRV